MGKRKKGKVWKRIRKLSVEQGLALAVNLHRAGIVDEAEHLYGEILSVVPDQPDATHFLGLIAHQHGDSEKGIALIKKSLVTNPDQPGPLNNLGNIYRELGQLDEARKMYSKVLELAPDHADTWANIGVILRQLSNPEEALKNLEKAIELNPKHVVAYHNLGNTLRDLQRFEEALDAYEMATKIAPEGTGKMSPKAIACVQYELGRKNDAIGTLQRWSYSHPDDVEARHLLAAHSGIDVPNQASQEYVRETFDGFSKSFDEILARLDYKAPKYVGELVVERLVDSVCGYRMLDIGCGTGLCGPLIKPKASTLVGVDLSPGMLKKARERGVYDTLEEAELTQYMVQNAGCCDVVTCVDTLCYIGDLSLAIPAAYSSLGKEGWFFFTVEQHSASEHEQGYWLQPHGRYSHSKAYLASLLEVAGFVVDTMKDVILRREGRDEVSGLLVAAKKTDSAE